MAACPGRIPPSLGAARSLKLVLSGRAPSISDADNESGCKALLAVIPAEWLRFVARKIALVMAARVKAHVNPALITWARETAGFPTPTEAAVQLSIEETQLAAWEDPTSEEKP